MINRRSFLVILFILGLAIFQLACGQPYPSDTEIKSTIGECLNTKFPSTWLLGKPLGGIVGQLIPSESLAKAAKVEVEETEVKDKQPFNKEGNYWPIKVRVKGAYQLNFGDKVEQRIKFEEVGDFRFSQNDQGKWQAVLQN